MVSQTCKRHADLCDFSSNVRLARISLLGNVFSGPLALAIDLADILIALAAPIILYGGQNAELPLRTWPDVRVEPAFRGRAELGFRGRQLRVGPRLDIWPDPSLRPTSAIAQRLVRASY